MTIDALPDVALLEIFHFYVDGLESGIKAAWYTLVHVCHRWRSIVFLFGSPDSPRRLNLRLYCTHNTPMTKTLKLWPPFPIVISVCSHEIRDIKNILAALKHNRTCEVRLWRAPTSQIKKVVESMRQPFPALTHLTLEPGEDDTVLEVSTSFLGGSAPLLQSIHFYHLSFPGLPKLLLSATHLVHLSLAGIPHSGYISPEVMVSCLSVLTRLKDIHIGFESRRSCPGQKSERPPLETRILPNLTKLDFRGASEYLEDLVARIKAPLLDEFEIIFFHQLKFDTPQLTEFIRRTPKFEANDESHVAYSDPNILVTIPQTLDGKIDLRVLCRLASQA